MQFFNFSNILFFKDTYKVSVLQDISKSILQKFSRQISATYYIGAMDNTESSTDDKYIEDNLSTFY